MSNCCVVRRRSAFLIVHGERIHAHRHCAEVLRRREWTQPLGCMMVPSARGVSCMLAECERTCALVEDSSQLFRA
jgi:hypothetical protein